MSDYKCTWKQSKPGASSQFVLFDGYPKWRKYSLTYVFTNDFPEAAEAALLRAFRRWEAVSQFTFTRHRESSGQAADVEVGFFSGRHKNCGDNEFDGPSGKILAHAYPPETGILHFNKERKWSLGVEPQGGAVDLETVAVHELGHILGLDHSDVREAVMYDRVYPSQIKRDLHQDDVEGILHLYS